MPRKFWKGMKTNVGPGIQLTHVGPPKKSRRKDRGTSDQRIEKLKDQHDTYGWKF